MRRSPLPAADLHGAAPLGSAARFRGRSQGERGALVRHRGGFGVSRSTPAVRAAERRSKRSMAVRPSLTSAESDSVHAARRTPPGSRAPRRDEKDWTRTPSPCRSRVAGAELRVRAPRRGCRPPAPSLFSHEKEGELEEPHENRSDLWVSPSRRRHWCRAVSDSARASAFASRTLRCASAFTFVARAVGKLSGLERDSLCSTPFHRVRHRAPVALRLPESLEPAPLRMRSR